MATNTLPKPSPQMGKTPLVIPNFKDFGNYLYDRIYLQLRHQELVNHQYTMFLILRDRSEESYIAEGKFMYAGLGHQKNALEEYNSEHCPAWEDLEKVNIDLENLPVTKEVMNHFKNDTLTIDQVKEPRKVSDSYDLNKRAEWPATRKAEYGVLNHYFEDAQELYFVGLPVFQFGEIEGIAQVSVHRRGPFR